MQKKFKKYFSEKVLTYLSVRCIIIPVRNRKTKHQTGMKEKTKIAGNLYEQFKQQAEEAEDKKNSKLYVSETVTEKTGEKVKETVRKAVEMIICDEEPGLITEDEAGEETAIEKLICKSL